MFEKLHQLPIVGGWIREQTNQVRSDIRNLLGRFRGERQHPVVKTSSKSQPDEFETKLPSKTLTVTVTSIERETPSAVTVNLQPITNEIISYIAGQFITLQLTLNGEVFHRAYSLCVPPRQQDTLTITVKEIPNGVVSSYINQRLKSGDKLEILRPSGRFTIVPESQRKKHYFLIAGGSGITPMKAIALEVLEKEIESYVTIIFGNRTENEIIFREKFMDISILHSDRFVVKYVVENPTSTWTDTIGILDKNVLSQLLDQTQRDEIQQTDHLYYLCGPVGMMTGAKELLRERNVSANQIHEERFFTLDTGKNKSTTPNTNTLDSQKDSETLVTIRLRGQPTLVKAKQDQSILDAGLAAGIPMPFSCTMGGCGACMVKLVSGKVTMPEPNGLTTDEVNAGYVLACVGCPNGECTVEIE